MATPDSTTKRCTKCGQEFPRTREYFYADGRNLDGLFSSCKACNRRAQKEYYTANTEAARLATRDYYARNKEKARAYIRGWQEDHPDKIAQYRLRSAEKKREAEKRRSRQYPSKKRAYNQSRKARKRSLAADFTVTQWQRALSYFEGCCAVCGRPAGLWHTLAQDHWIPMNKGGAYTASNIIPLCNGIGGCNQNKKDKAPDLWLTERYGKRKARQILKRIEEYFAWVMAQTDSISSEIAG
jgi:5-methylcytosine-specific restriction endonuclease McrA